MASTKSAKRTRKEPEICVKEEFKIAVKIALDRFRFDEKQKGKAVEIKLLVECFVVTRSLVAETAEIGEGKYTFKCYFSK